MIKYGTGVDLLLHEVALARPELMTNQFAQAIIAHHTSPEDPLPTWKPEAYDVQ